MTAAPIGTVWEARLAGVACRRDAVSVESLEAQGYVAGDPDPRYGSVWMVRPAEDEEEPR